MKYGTVNRAMEGEGTSANTNCYKIGEMANGDSPPLNGLLFMV